VAGSSNEEGYHMKHKLLSVVSLTLLTGYNSVFSDAEAFNAKVHLLWLGHGTEEGQGIKRSSEMLTEAGIKNTYHVSQGTAHEWLTWHRCLHEFAPLLFKN
jgi:hypothetical protein